MRVWIAAFFAAGAALAGSAAEADGLIYGANTGPNASDFSGIDVGLDLGPAFGSSTSANTSGVAGGVHAGYSLQQGPIVGGVEGDVFLGDIEGCLSDYGSLRLSTLSSARLRGGYAFGNILAYGTLGFAISGSRYSSALGAADKTLTGYVFGAGAEYALTRNIALRAELRRYNFDTATYALPTGPDQETTSQNLLLIGVSARF